MTTPLLRISSRFPRTFLPPAKHCSSGVHLHHHHHQQPLSSTPTCYFSSSAICRGNNRTNGLEPQQLFSSSRNIPTTTATATVTATATATQPSRTMASKTTPSPALKQPLNIACVQLASGSDKSANLAHAREQVLSAASNGAKLVVLPECFNSPYGCDHFPSYAETLLPSPPTEDQSPSYHALSSMARDAGVFLVGGSIPERVATTDESSSSSSEKYNYYNTSLIFSPDGTLLATHRKVHLFDISIPGGITFRESDVLSPGDKLTLVDLPGYGLVAVAICYDVRFPEMATIAARRGAFALIYPGAFNLTTGPLHWKLLGQSRAVDNQCYVVLCSPARDMSEGVYHAYGHSMVVDPMGAVVVEAGEGGDSEVIGWEFDPKKIEDTRRNIPLSGQRRFDVYPDINEGDVKV